MANVSYDTLTIQINADSKNANKSISNLSKNLRNLEKTAQNTDYKSIERVQKLLQDISLIDFTNVATGLKNVVMAFKTLEHTSARTKSNIDSIDTEKLNSLASDMKNIEPKWDANNLPNWKELVQFNGQRFADVNIVPQVDVSNLKQTLSTFQKMRKTVETILHPLKALKKQLGIVGEEGKKTANKWFNAFKRIAFYRVIRRLIQLITQSIKESMQALAEYSPEFSQAIGAIRSSFKNLANSIIVILAPILQVLSPILETLNHTLVDINNSIASAFGGSEVIQATKNVEDYNDALKKTKTTSLGIDELNVISQDDSGNFFETIKQADTGFVDTFKEGFADILEVVKTIGGYLKEFANKILPIIRPIIKDIFRLVSSIMDVINVFIEDTAEGVNTSLASFVGFIGQIVDFVVVLVKSLMPTIKAILKAISPIINFINSVIESIFNFLTPIVRLVEMILPLLEVALIPLNAIISAVATVFYIVKGIAEVLVAIITFQFDKIGDIFDDTVEGIKNTWSSFADSTVKTWQTNISGTVQVQNGTLEGISGATTSADVGQAISGSSITSPISYVSSSQGSSQETIVNVYLDSREIAKQVEIIQKNKGASTFNSEGLSYGK